MIGSKATTSTIAHSTSVRDLNPLSPGVSADGNSGGGGGGGAGGDGNSTGGIRSRSATISQVRTGGSHPNAAPPPQQATYGQAGGQMDRVPVPVPKNLNALFGVSPSDIDKYSRVVFPVCFICFNMMYWVIYLHISKILDNPDFA
jgi:glycine receptor alpha-3